MLSNVFAISTESKGRSRDHPPPDPPLDHQRKCPPEVPCDSANLSTTMSDGVMERPMGRMSSSMSSSPLVAPPASSTSCERACVRISFVEMTNHLCRHVQSYRTHRTG